MNLFIDLFGYLSIIVHGLTIVSQSMAVGGVLFLIFLAGPLAGQIGLAGPRVMEDTTRVTAWAASSWC